MLSEGPKSPIAEMYYFFPYSSFHKSVFFYCTHLLLPLPLIDSFLSVHSMGTTLSISGGWAGGIAAHEYPGLQSACPSLSGLVRSARCAVDTDFMKMSNTLLESLSLLYAAPIAGNINIVID